MVTFKLVEPVLSNWWTISLHAQSLAVALSSPTYISALSSQLTNEWYSWLRSSWLGNPCQKVSLNTVERYNMVKPSNYMDLNEGFPRTSPWNLDGPCSNPSSAQGSSCAPGQEIWSSDPAQITIRPHLWNQNSRNLQALQQTALDRFQGSMPCYGPPGRRWHIRSLQLRYPWPPGCWRHQHQSPRPPRGCWCIPLPHHFCTLWDSSKVGWNMMDELEPDFLEEFWFVATVVSFLVIWRLKDSLRSGWARWNHALVGGWRARCSTCVANAWNVQTFPQSMNIY